MNTRPCTWHRRTPDGVVHRCDAPGGHTAGVLIGEHSTGQGDDRITWHEGEIGAWQEPPAGHPRRPSEITPNGSTREGWLRGRLGGGLGRTTTNAVRDIMVRTLALPETDRAALVEDLHQVLDEVEHWKDAWSTSSRTW